MTLGAFITGTGTGVGKTFVTRGIARSLLRQGLRPAAVKPIETGVDPNPLDALALARACQRPELAADPEFYRAALPLAPYAVSRVTGRPGPDLPRILARLRACARAADSLWVEGAGGLLVPLDEATSMAEFAQQLGLPLILVAQNQLGVLSYVLSCVESARRRELDVKALVLTPPSAPHAADPSPQTNAAILAERVRCPVLSFPSCANDDEELANAIDDCGLLSAMHCDAR